MDHAGVATAGTLQDAAVRDGGLSVGAGARLQRLGYEVERGQHGQPEIRLYTEYMEASSPRRQQITENLAEQAVWPEARRSRRTRRARRNSI